MARSFPTLLLLLGLTASLVAGCDAADPVDPPTPAPPDPVVAQQRAIERMHQASVDAWNGKDAEAYASFYTEDAEFLSPLGSIYVGRDAIRAQHAFLFSSTPTGPFPSGPYFPSALSSRVRRIVSVSPTMAVVDVDTRVTPLAFVPLGLPQYESGVLRVLIKWVVVSEGGEWRIRTQHMTAVQPGVQLPF